MKYEIVYRPLSYNNPGTPMESIVGGVAHDTECPGDTDTSEYNYFNETKRGASAHAFVDWDSITQCIPWTNVAWHAGPSANKNRIGVEMCYTNDLGKFAEIWKRTTWLWAYLFVNVIKKPLNSETLMSHAEVSERWKETDHTDPIAYFAKFGKTMGDFRHDIQVQIDLMKEASKVDINEAVKILQENKIINTPEYWLSATNIVKNLDQLLINMATKLK